MRRTLLFSAVAGLFAVGVGCKHVGGTCDCAYSPDDAKLPVPGNAYPTIGGPVAGVVSAAPAAAAPAPVPAPPVTPEKMPLPR